MVGFVYDWEHLEVHDHREMAFKSLSKGRWRLLITPGMVSHELKGATYTDASKHEPYMPQSSQKA